VPRAPSICLITPVISGQQYRSQSSSLCNFLQSAVISPLLPTTVSLSTLFSNTISLCSSFSVGDQVSHPYTTVGKITVLYILTLTYLDSKQEHKRSCTECNLVVISLSMQLSVNIAVARHSVWSLPPVCRGAALSAPAAATSHPPSYWRLKSLPCFRQTVPAVWIWLITNC